MLRHWLIISFLTFLVIFQSFEHHKVPSGPDLGYSRLWLAGLAGLAGLRLAVLWLRARLTSLQPLVEKATPEKVQKRYEKITIEFPRNRPFEAYYD